MYLIRNLSKLKYTVTAAYGATTLLPSNQNAFILLDVEIVKVYF